MFHISQSTFALNIWLCCCFLSLFKCLIILWLKLIQFNFVWLVLSVSAHFDRLQKCQSKVDDWFLLFGAWIGELAHEKCDFNWRLLVLEDYATIFYQFRSSFAYHFLKFQPLIKDWIVFLQKTYDKLWRISQFLFRKTNNKTFRSLNTK